MAAEVKICNGCKVAKGADNFYRYSKGKLYHRCIPCIAEYNRAQTVKHAEKRRSYDRARGNGWDRSGREKWTISEQSKYDSYLRRTYGITLAQYDMILTNQGGVCAICKKSCNRTSTVRLCVDHDHSNGIVRGLLCFQCNVGLGKFGDSAENLKSAIDYLERNT
jgi:hypothetical protein